MKTKTHIDEIIKVQDDGDYEDVDNPENSSSSPSTSSSNENVAANKIIRTKPKTNGISSTTEALPIAQEDNIFDFPSSTTLRSTNSANTYEIPKTEAPTRLIESVISPPTKTQRVENSITTEVNSAEAVKVTTDAITLPSTSLLPSTKPSTKAPPPIDAPTTTPSTTAKTSASTEGSTQASTSSSTLITSSSTAQVTSAPILPAMPAEPVVTASATSPSSTSSRGPAIGLSTKASAGHHSTNHSSNGDPSDQEPHEDSENHGKTGGKSHRAHTRKGVSKRTTKSKTTKALNTTTSPKTTVEVNKIK